MSTETAAVRVLNTAELLEHILWNSSWQDALLQQRVNPFWRATVNISAKLQRRLFLASTTKPLAYRGWFLHHRIPTLTTREHSNFEDYLGELELEAFYEWADPENSLNEHGLEAIRSRAPEMHKVRAQAAGIGWPKSINPFMPTLFKHFEDESGIAFTVDRSKIKGAHSWKSMYLTEPPVTSIYAVLIPEWLKAPEEGLTATEEEEYQENDHTSCLETSAELIYNASGITLGDLVEAMDSKYGEDVDTFYFARLTASKIQTPRGEWIWAPRAEMQMDDDSH
jgi:hypothetical protein